MVIIYWYIRDFFSFIGTIVKSFFDVVLSLINILIASGKFLFDVVSALPVSIKIFLFFFICSPPWLFVVMLGSLPCLLIVYQKTFGLVKYFILADFCAFPLVF